MYRWRSRVLCLLMLSVVTLGVPLGAWATGTACSNVAAATSAAPPVFSDMITCAFDTVAPYSLLSSVILLVVPLLVVVWGIKGGFRLIGGLFMRGFRAIGSR